MKSPDDVLRSTTPEIQKIITEILKYEREYQHFKNLSALKDKENELCDRISKLISSEIQ